MVTAVTAVTAVMTSSGDDVISRARAFIRASDDGLRDDFPAERLEVTGDG